MKYHGKGDKKHRRHAADMEKHLKDEEEKDKKELEAHAE